MPSTAPARLGAAAGRERFGGRVPPIDQLARAAPNAPKGLNENYGRELLELHTLGVDGGYTQKDVTEVARAFTGWTIDNPRQGGGFRFEPRLHDDGEKVVLGHGSRRAAASATAKRCSTSWRGIPSTARFIATKLARRFVERHAAAGARGSRGGAFREDRRRSARGDARRS